MNAEEYRISVPASCLPQILAQRTGCKVVEDPAKAWADSVLADWREVAPYLPEECKTSLDIGCGMAGFDILLHRARNPFIYLLDRDEVDAKPRYGFGDTPSAYCKWAEVEAMMQANGVPRGRWFPVRDSSIVIANLDLVTSFIAWGFHFPVGVYLHDVAKLLRPGGRLIIDIRGDHFGDANDMIIESIGRGICLSDHGKFLRCIYERADA